MMFDDLGGFGFQRAGVAFAQNRFGLLSGGEQSQRVRPLQRGSISRPSSWVSCSRS